MSTEGCAYFARLRMKHIKHVLALLLALALLLGSALGEDLAPGARGEAV